tara:strand:+ start:253 stop:450 length:198 start_codon:yes stop_codon:yes gene_type:complete
MTNVNTVVQTEDDVRTIEAKNSIQNQLESDMAAFLSKGGLVEEVDANITSDPPSRPASKYGGQPI